MTQMSRLRPWTIAGAMIALWAALVTAPARAIEIEEVRSASGIVAWLVRDTTVPLIAMSFTFKGGGSSLDPMGKEGLAEMAMSLLDEGAGDLDAQGFKQALEAISASVSFDAGRDRLGGGFRTLTENRHDAFRLLRLALMNPRFDDEAIARVRDQLFTQLKRAAENPREIANRAWFKTVFPEHPYGRPPSGTAETVAQLGRDDFARLVQERLARENLVIGVVGDITADELARRLDDVFGALAQTPSGVAVPEAAPQGAGKLLVVKRPIPQSVVVFGHAGIKRDDADYYPAYVMNYVLGGGGFSSRLNDEVRNKRGLAYSIYSYLSPMDRAGLIMGGVATQNARVKESVDLVRGEWRRLAAEGVSATELADAKTYINGSFPLQLDASGRIASMLVSIQLDRLGIDYITRRAELIGAVTAEDVRRVARRLLRADDLTVVVVGDPQGVEPTP